MLFSAYLHRFVVALPLAVETDDRPLDLGLALAGFVALLSDEIEFQAFSHGAGVFLTLNSTGHSDIFLET